MYKKSFWGSTPVFSYGKKFEPLKCYQENWQRSREHHYFSILFQPPTFIWRLLPKGLDNHQELNTIEVKRTTTRTNIHETFLEHLHHLFHILNSFMHILHVEMPSFK